MDRVSSGWQPGNSKPSVGITSTRGDLLRLRLDALASTSLVTSVANIPVAALLAGVFWDVAPHAVLVSWLAALICLMGLRWLLVRTYRRDIRHRWSPRRWAVIGIAQSGLLGATWGAACLSLAGHGGTFHSTMLVAASLCIVMGALANVAYWPAHLSFQVPLFLLEAIGFATAGHPEGFSFAGGLLVSSAALGLLAPCLGAHVMSGLRLAEEKRALIESLQQANELLQRLSVTDALTELPNRRALDSVLAYEWKRALRTGRPIGLLMLDVDRFKILNDTFGHQAGDACLQLIAETLRVCVRQNIDQATRYGGEEFAVILPETDLAGACLIAERIRAAIAATRHLHRGVDCGAVSVSVGVASMTPQGTSLPEELITRADCALYDAKAGGRNRVVADGPEGAALVA